MNVRINSIVDMFCVLNDLDRMAAEFDWTSAVGDLDPAVLAIQLNDGPKIAGEIMDKIHNTLDRQDRYRAIQLFAGSLGRQSAETMARVCEEPEGLQHVLIGIVSANFFCGHPKEDFLGPYEDLVRSLLLGKYSPSPDAEIRPEQGVHILRLTYFESIHILVSCWSPNPAKAHPPAVRSRDTGRAQPSVG